MRTLKTFLLACSLFSCTIAGAQAQTDPCSGTDIAANEVGLVYEGHCLVATTDGPSVQSVVVKRIEDLDGATVLGVLLIRTQDGWVVSGETFYADQGVADAEVGDGGYLVVDGTP